MFECLRDHSLFRLIRKPSGILIYRTGSIVSSLHALRMKRKLFPLRLNQLSCLRQLRYVAHFNNWSIAKRHSPVLKDDGFTIRRKKEFGLVLR
jgi:hypothetical protein